MSNKEFADGLRSIADFYEQHQEIPAPSGHSVDNYTVDSRDEAAAVIRALGSCEKDYSLSDYMTIRKDFGQVRLQFIFTRANVCTRKVVGVETIPAQFVPAQTKEIVEWECSPILADDARPAEAQHRTVADSEDIPF